MQSFTLNISLQVLVSQVACRLSFFIWHLKKIRWLCVFSHGNKVDYNSIHNIIKKAKLCGVFIIYKKKKLIGFKYYYNLYSLDLVYLEFNVAF